MKILVINPYYKPYENPRAYRWTRICEAWALKGHNIHVITTSVEKMPSQEIINGVLVNRIGNPKPTVSPFNPLNKKNKGSSLISRIAKSFMKSWMWPDESMFWKSPALDVAKKQFLKHHYDHVVTVSLPFTSHLIGLELKKIFAFTWSIDVGDPFNQHDIYPRNNTRLYKTKNKRTEENIVYACDHIFVTNKALKHIYINEYNVSPEKVVAIPPLGTNSSINLNEVIKNPIITIGYFGSFYKKVREATALLQLIKALKKTEVDFIIKIFGNIKKEFSKLLLEYPDHITISERIPREDVIEEMRKMDILLNIGNKSNHQLPSKVVDYLFSGVPIINLKEDNDDLFQDFTKSFNHTLNLQKDDLEDINSLENFLNKSPHIRLSQDQITRIKIKYSGGKIAEEYLHYMTQRES